MISALYAAGAIIFIISIIAGFKSGSFLGFILSVAGGILSAIIPFALAKILENQETMLSKMQHIEEMIRNFRSQQKKICTKCNYKYGADYSSCPRCGNRE